MIVFLSFHKQTTELNIFWRFSIFAVKTAFLIHQRYSIKDSDTFIPDIKTLINQSKRLLQVNPPSIEIDSATCSNKPAAPLGDICDDLCLQIAHKMKINELH